MKIKSLASKTDVAVLGPSQQIEEGNGYLVVRCVDNPGFVWGNYLLFDKPPKQGDLAHWCELYDEAFGTTEGIINQTFLWDRSDGEVGAAAEFIDAGFSLEKTMVLTCEKAIKPRKWNGQIEVRPIAGDAEYEAATELQVRSREPIFPEESYRGFRQARMAAYRALVEEGRGEWFGAFLKGELVGDLGLFIVGSLGRYQFVSTDPEYRRQGVCSTLMFETARRALKRKDVHTLVIASDPEYHSTIVYKSVGFEFKEWQVGMTREIKK